jgi:NADH-quinone oxidoreductase subunit J
VWAFEITSALLITAALGAMVLAHRERVRPRQGQRELSQERFRKGGQVTPLPSPGVYARNNAVDMPALLPDGSFSELSVNRALQRRAIAPRRTLSGGTTVEATAMPAQPGANGAEVNGTYRTQPESGRPVREDDAR